MVDINRLKGAIVTKGKTQEDVAKRLNMAPKTFYLKMKKGVFDSDEIAAIVDDLDIENPMEIFFAEEVTW